MIPSLDPKPQTSTEGKVAGSSASAPKPTEESPKVDTQDSSQSGEKRTEKHQAAKAENVTQSLNLISRILATEKK